MFSLVCIAVRIAVFLLESTMLHRHVCSFAATVGFPPHLERKGGLRDVQLVVVIDSKWVREGFQLLQRLLFGKHIADGKHSSDTIVDSSPGK